MQVLASLPVTGGEGQDIPLKDIVSLRRDGVFEEWRSGLKQALINYETTRKLGGEWVAVATTQLTTFGEEGAAKVRKVLYASRTLRTYLPAWSRLSLGAVSLGVGAAMGSAPGAGLAGLGAATAVHAAASSASAMRRAPKAKALLPHYRYIARFPLLSEGT